MPAYRTLLLASSLATLFFGGCAWIPAEDLKAALDRDPDTALGLQVVENPQPAVLSDCALPAAPTVRLAFADAFAGRSVTLAARLDSQAESVPIDAFDLPDVLDPTLTVAIPIEAGACPDGCSTLTIEARATDENGDVLEQQVDVDLEVRVFDAALVDVLVGSTPPADVSPTPADASPAQALDVAVHDVLAFTLTADRADALSEVLPGIAPVVEACFGTSCQALSTVPDPEGPAGGVPGAVDRYHADLTGLADTCGDALPDPVTLQVRLVAPDFSAEAGCADRIFDPQVPAARFVIQDCDQDGQVAEAWAGDDCDDQEPAVRFDAGSEELCDHLDNNCDGVIDNVGPFYEDADMDGFGDELLVDADCDNPPSVHTSSLVAGDCADDQPHIHPNRPEIPCDGVDNDCSIATPDDAMTDQWYADLDGDGSGDPSVVFATSCPLLLSTPVVPNGDDCAPTTALEPQLYAVDGDSDGLGDPGSGIVTCAGEPDATDRVPNEDDCDDTSAAVLAASLWYPDADGDGLGTPGVGIESCAPIADRATNDWDCDDSAGVYPDQPAFGVILADGTAIPASGPSGFDWQTAGSYATLEICPSTAGAVSIPSITLASPITITSPTATRMPVTSAVAGTRLFTVDAPAVTLAGLSIAGNGAVADDGGCLAVTGSLTLDNVSMTGCESDGSGGAVHVDGGTLDVLFGSELTANIAQDGGAIGGFDADITVEDSSIRNNEASSRGGGVFAQECALTVLSSDVDDNTANIGGGIALAASRGAQVQDVGMRRNAALDGSALTTGSDGSNTTLGAPPLSLIDVVIETDPAGGDSTIFVDEAIIDPPTPDLEYTNVTIPLQADDFDVRFENDAGVFFVGPNGSCSQSTGGCSL